MYIYVYIYMCIYHICIYYIYCLLPSAYCMGPNGPAQDPTVRLLVKLPSE